MGFLDDAKEKLGQAKDKIEDLVDGNEDKVEDGIDKAADKADEATGGKYDDQIDAGAEKAKDALGVDDAAPAGSHPCSSAPSGQPGPAPRLIDQRFVVVPASYVFLLRDGVAGTEVLLQLRQNTGYMDDHWAAAAAGHVEKGETAYDAARREAREEIGVDDLDLVFATSMQRTRGGEPIDERIDFFFTARSWSGTPRIIEPAKCAALEWYPAVRAAGPGGAARAARAARHHRG